MRAFVGAVALCVRMLVFTEGGSDGVRFLSKIYHRKSGRSMLKMFRKLLGSVREFKLASILTMVFVTGEVVIDCAIPFLVAELVNTIEVNKESPDMGAIIMYGSILIGLSLLSLILGGLAGSTCATASCGFGRNLRRDLFGRIQAFSFEDIDRFSTSSLVTRLTTDVTNIQSSYMMLIRTAVRSPLMIIFSVVMAAVRGGKLALVFAAVAPILAIGLAIITRLAFPLFTRVFKKYDRLNESVEENIRGMRVVKSYVREDFEREKFGRASDDVCVDFTKAEKILAINNPLMQFCLNAVMLVVMFFGAKIIVSTGGSELQVGSMQALLTYGMQILFNLMMVSFMFVMAILSLESARRVTEVLNTEPSMKNREDGITEVPDGSIEFDNVSFKYAAAAEKMTLSDVNLRIASGETIGIIGGTGSSKTTLIQLISRLYDTTDGTVRVGGNDVRDYDLTALRDQVAVVLQKNVLFSGTIAENLRWGNPDATEEELAEACRLAQADEFISHFPDGYNTYIEQGGTNVSGGQKQRLCIARALLKRPKVLILDDSTSAVDTKTDALIRRGFREFIPETTKIIIAQRLASVQDADRIVLLDGGNVAAVGNHDELLGNCEIYREIWDSQNNKGGDADVKE